MKLDEAIEHLEADVKLDREGRDRPLYKAKQLGIEALKLVERCRENHCDTSFDDLPGETE